MKTIKIAFVGGPQSGKTSLVEYLRNYLKSEYDVVIAEEAPTVCLRAGLNPPYNISGLEFQLEVLKEYKRIYKRIDIFEKLVKHEKPVVILYDTVPLIGSTYLKNGDTRSYDVWKANYDACMTMQEFKNHKPDVVFNCELLQSSYSPEGNAVRRELETQKVLSVSDKIDSLFPDAILLSNRDSIEERANKVVEYIDKKVNEVNSISVKLTDTKITMHQSCVSCGWNESIDINRLYKFCPMCGKSLTNIQRYDPFTPYPGVPTYPNITWTCQESSSYTTKSDVPHTLT